MKKLSLESGLAIELESIHEEGKSIIYDYVIKVGGENVGYVEVVEFDGDYIVFDLHIVSEQRRKGYGTQILLILVEEYGGYYLAPTDEDNQRLYERLGEEVTCPYEIDQGYGVYYIQ